MAMTCRSCGSRDRCEDGRCNYCGRANMAGSLRALERSPEGRLKRALQNMAHRANMLRLSTAPQVQRVELARTYNAAELLAEQLAEFMEGRGTQPKEELSDAVSHAKNRGKDRAASAGA